MDSEWLIRLRAAAPGDIPLFCLPYAGGSAATYHRWHHLAPPGIHVNAVELPGRGSRLEETPFVRIPPLVRSLAGALDGRLDRPYAVFGHSMGGLIAFELVRALRERGYPQPVHLFVSATAAPGSRPGRPPLHSASDEEVMAELRSLNGTPQELLDNEELMALAIPTLRADYSILQSYEYRDKPPLDIPVTVFGGISDRITPPASLNGWRRQSTAGTRLRLLPGDHFFVNDSAPQIMGAISETLARPGNSAALADSTR